METPVILPGFMTPSSPNEDQRIFGTANGSINFEIETLTEGAHIPKYNITITRENGSDIIPIVGMTTEVFVFEDSRKAVLRIPSTELELQAGTYMLTVMDGPRQVLRRSLTVLAHPANAFLQATSDQDNILS